jgi:hypothetical protein
MKRDGLGWQPPLLPDDPAERRKIGIRLVILAALGVIAQIIFHHRRLVVTERRREQCSELCMVVDTEMARPGHKLCPAGRTAVA